MASGKDYSNLYGQAYVAYGQGNYEEAASYIEEMGEAYPDDPNVLLLQGHIYLGLERYDIAQQKYEKVLQISERQDLRDCAVQSLEQVQSITGVVIKTESRTVESSKNIVRTGEEEKTLLPGMGESTFVVSSDVAAQQFQFGEVFPAFSDTRGENNPNIPTYQPWLGETDPAHLDSLLDRDAIPTVQISPSQQRERGEDLMPNLDEFNDASLDNLADFDLTDIAPELPDSSLFYANGRSRYGDISKIKRSFCG